METETVQNRTSVTVVAFDDSSLLSVSHILIGQIAHAYHLGTQAMMGDGIENQTLGQELGVNITVGEERINKVMETTPQQPKVLWSEELRS